MSVEFHPTASGYHVRPPFQPRVDLGAELDALLDITRQAVSIAKFAIESLLQKKESGNPQEMDASFEVETGFLTHVALHSPNWALLSPDQREHILKTFHGMDSFSLKNIHQAVDVSKQANEFYKYSIRPSYLKTGYQFAIVDPKKFQFKDTKKLSRTNHSLLKHYDLSTASCFTWAFASAGIPLDDLFLYTTSRRLGRPPKFTDYIEFLTNKNWEKASPPIQKKDIIIYFQQPGEEPTHAAFAISLTQVSAKWGNNNHQAYFHREEMTLEEDGPYYLIYRKPEPPT